MSEQNGCANADCNRVFDPFYESFITMEFGNQETTYERLGFCSIKCIREYFSDSYGIAVVNPPMRVEV